MSHNMDQWRRRVELQIIRYHLQNNPKAIGVNLKQSVAENGSRNDDGAPKLCIVEQPTANPNAKAKQWNNREFLEGLLQGLLVAVVQTQSVVMLMIIVFLFCWLWFKTN
jgi:hypothetical protein